MEDPIPGSAGKSVVRRLESLLSEIETRAMRRIMLVVVFLDFLLIFAYIDDEEQLIHVVENELDGHLKYDLSVVSRDV